VQPPAATIRGSEYGRLLPEIKERIRAAQYEALRAVNRDYASSETLAPPVREAGEDLARPLDV
jgi:hypothetical protein